MLYVGCIRSLTMQPVFNEAHSFDKEAIMSCLGRSHPKLVTGCRFSCNMDCAHLLALLVYL